LNFWDTSALITLYLPEYQTAVIQDFFKSCEKGKNSVWTLTLVEFVSTLCRLKRETKLAATTFDQVHREIIEFLKTANQVEDVERVKERACRLLHVHPLKAADALQLAAALCACLERPQGQTFVTLDSRLASSASREGFSIYPPHFA
jgi:predicted nucleic acid-binding protein